MKKALKLALEALETLHDENMDYLTRNKLGGENNQCMVFAREAITAIKEALAQEQEPVAWEQFYPDIGKPKFVAQPEQEPVAWISHNAGLYHFKPDESLDPMPLYTTPPQRKPLPYEQLDSLWQNIDTGDFELDIREFARAIEAAHGIKE